MPDAASELDAIIEKFRNYPEAYKVWREDLLALIEREKQKARIEEVEWVIAGRDIVYAGDRLVDRLVSLKASRAPSHAQGRHDDADDHHNR